MWTQCTLPAPQEDWSSPKRLLPGGCTSRDQKCYSAGAIQRARDVDGLQTPWKDLATFYSPAKKVSAMAQATYGKDVSFVSCDVFILTCSAQYSNYDLEKQVESYMIFDSEDVALLFLLS